MKFRTRSPAVLLQSIWRRINTWCSAAVGQGLVEYSMILMLIAVVIIGIMTLFGGEVSSMFSDVHSGLGNAMGE